MDLSSLPVETLEDILSEIDLPVDLLQLALTCSLLVSLIIPRHLYYRVIHHTIEGGSHIWEALAKDKDLARNVRVLELGRPNAGPSRAAIQLAHQRSIHPPLLAEDAMQNNMLEGVLRVPNLQTPVETLIVHEEASEKLFRGALRNMQRLVRFQWGPQNPENAVVNTSTDADVDDIWHILCTLPTLRHMSVADIQARRNRTPIRQSVVSTFKNSEYAAR